LQNGTIFLQFLLEGARVRSPRTQKLHARLTRFGWAQRSTSPECNGGASPWRHSLLDHCDLSAK